MRVTQSMISNNMLTNLSNSYSKLDQYNNQIATGKKISRPSDDPVVAMNGMFYRTDVSDVEQYQRNLSEAQNWAQSSDDALSQVTNSLQRIRELTGQSINDTNSDGSRQAAAEEIKQEIEHLATLGNTMIGEKYLFNGIDTTKKPVNLNIQPDPTNPGQIVIDNSSSFYTNNSSYDIEVSKGVKLRVNVDPSNVFDKGTFDKLVTAYNNIVSGNSAGMDQSLGEIDKILDNVTTAQTKIGATENRIDMVNDRLGSQKVIAKSIMSNNEDVDVAEAITNLKIQQTVQNAALGVGARIIQPTLLDFLH